ncbi:MAG: alpha/beta hydrolase [Candidatus Marinimicrobia bacterium]|nr:alpha/beta hydrolase [Candidatus Neomarinimicrobiota bacterium]
MKKSFLTIIVVFIISLTTCSTRYIQAEQSNELVVLLHGIKDKPYMMWKLEKGLKNADYAVINLHYPSAKAGMDSILNLIHGRLEAPLKRYRKINFVTHSLGGIVMRAYLDKYSRPNFSRLVMIAPPNRGAIMAERFEDFFLYQWLYGEAGQKLGKDSSDYWQQFPEPIIPFGIIAGGLGNKNGFNPLIPGDDDGTVGVEETRIQGYEDFIVLPGLHTSLLWQDNTLEQVLLFLKEGHFKKNSN